MMRENNAPLQKIRDLAKELGHEDDYVDRVYVQEYAGSLPDEMDPDDLLDAIRAKLFLLFKAAALIAEERMEKQGLLPKDGSFLVFIEPSCEDASAILITYRRPAAPLRNLPESLEPTKNVREKAGPANHPNCMSGRKQIPKTLDRRGD